MRLISSTQNSWQGPLYQMTVGRFFFVVRNLSYGQSVDASKNRPRTHEMLEWFVPTVLLIFQKHFDTHYIRRNSRCPMDGHTDSPMECPKPYRNRNRYLYYIYLLCSLSYGCPKDTFLISFWSSPIHSVKLKIYLLTWCKAVLSYACKKARRYLI